MASSSVDFPDPFSPTIYVTLFENSNDFKLRTIGRLNGYESSRDETCSFRIAFRNMFCPSIFIISLQYFYCYPSTCFCVSKGTI